MRQVFQYSSISDWYSKRAYRTFAVRSDPLLDDFPRLAYPAFAPFVYRTMPHRPASQTIQLPKASLNRNICNKVVRILLVRLK